VLLNKDVDRSLSHFTWVTSCFIVLWLI